MVARTDLDPVAPHSGGWSRHDQKITDLDELVELDPNGLPVCGELGEERPT